MNKIASFLNKHEQYYIIYMGIAFVIFLITWFAMHAPAVDEANRQTDAPASSQATISGFTPHANNVSQRTLQQLDALRLRVVKAPTDTTHLLRLAQLLQDAHQLEEAAINYKHYLALRPKNRQAWLDYAQSLGQMSSWREAQAAVEQMLVHYPGDPSGLYNLGAVYANLSLITEARNIWERVAAQEEDLEISTMAQTSLVQLNAFVKPQWGEGK